MRKIVKGGYVYWKMDNRGKFGRGFYLLARKRVGGVPPTKKKGTLRKTGSWRRSPSPPSRLDPLQYFREGVGSVPEKPF